MQGVFCITMINPLFLNIIHRAKDFIGTVDLITCISGDFAQNAGFGKFLDILPGGFEWHTYAFCQLFRRKN